MSRHRILGVFALFACLLLAWPSLAQQNQKLWVARLNGPVSSNDVAFAIAVDSSGNSYVTGSICVGLFLGQCLTTSWETVKYDTNGITNLAVRMAKPKTQRQRMCNNGKQEVALF